MMKQKHSKKQNQKQLSKIDKAKKWYAEAPTNIKIIVVILICLVIGLLIVGLVKLFSPKPKSYEEFREIADEVIEAESRAVENSGAFKPLDQQLERKDYEREVLGIEDKNYTTATEAQIEGVINVLNNNEQARQLGGIATPQELVKYKDDNPKSLVAAKAVEERIALSQGKDMEESLAEALYMEPGMIEENAKISDQVDQRVIPERIVRNEDGSPTNPF